MRSQKLEKFASESTATNILIFFSILYSKKRKLFKIFPWYEQKTQEKKKEKEKGLKISSTLLFLALFDDIADRHW